MNYEEDHYYNHNYEDDLIDDEDYALLAKALIIKSKLQEATIDIHQEIIRKIQPSIINSALFTMCQPYPSKKIKYKRQITNTMFNTINNVNNQYEMNCKCPMIDLIINKRLKCTYLDCTASYHEQCNETSDEFKYCVKCTLNKQKEEQKFNNYTNINQNILFRLTFKALDVLQCIIQFLSFIDYTRLKMTSYILYTQLVCSKARYGVYSMDITQYGMTKISMIKALKYWKNCIKHLNIELFWITKILQRRVWKNVRKLKQLNSISIQCERTKDDDLVSVITTFKKHLYPNNIEKIELKEIYLKYEDILSHEFWKSICPNKHLIINEMKIINCPDNIQFFKKKLNQPLNCLGNIRILHLRDIKPYTMMYLILYFCQQNLQELTIDFFNKEPTRFIPTEIQYQFNNLKSIHIYNYCFYQKFNHLFKSCLPVLENIHFSDLHVDAFDDDDYYDYNKNKNNKKKACIIHLLLNSAPKLQTIKIDEELGICEFVPFCEKIYKCKNNNNDNIVQKLPQITFCVCDNYYHLNEPPNIDSYKWIVDGVILLINSFISNILVNFKCMEEGFYSYIEKLQDIIDNEINKDNNYFIKFTNYQDEMEIESYTVLRIFYNDDLK